MEKTIHIRLRAFRHKKGYTIAQVSEKIGVPISTYKEWENGRQIRGEPYVALAKVFEVSLHELLTGDGGRLGDAFNRIQQIENTLNELKKDLISLS